MFMWDLTLFFAFSLSACRIVAASNIAARYKVPVTDHVLNLTVHDYRAEFLRKRQFPLPVGQEDLANIKNRLHLANVLVGGFLFPLAINTASSTTWVANSSFVCFDSQGIVERQSKCNLGRTFQSTLSKTLGLAPSGFTSRYHPDLFAEGKFVEERIIIAGVSVAQPYFNVPHIIGIAEKGHWNGHGIASGVLGLGFENEEDPFSIIQTMFEDTPKIFSLALFRDTSDATTDVTTGGVLAFGGVPNNIPTDGLWIKTPILPRSLEVRWGYRIRVDGFDIRPPPGSPELGSRPGGPYISDEEVMVVDSSTPTVIVPPVVALYTASLFRHGGRFHRPYNKYLVACNSPAPRVGIVISGISYYISDADLRSPAPELGDNECILELESSVKGLSVLGDVWLRNVLAVFDFTDEVKRQGPEYANGVLRIAGREVY